MIDRFFARRFMIRRLHDGPLGEYMERFAEHLWKSGYSRDSGRTKLRLIADLGGWLQQQGLGVDALNEETIQTFLDEGKRLGFSGCRENGGPATLRQLLALLRDIGEIPTPPPQGEITPLQRIEQDFTKYLTQERRLSRSTLRNVLPCVRRFLTERFGAEPPLLGELCPADVTGFLLRHLPMLSVWRAKNMAYALRSFFRFLRLRGDIATDLSASIPKVADWRCSTLPKALGAEDVEKLLMSCDQSTVIGQRDYTILLLLARLGMRAGEVVSMTLDDIDWEAGEFKVHGKGGREDRLPIPQDVGEALAHYVRHGRPSCASRRVFVRLHAPRRGFSSAVAICDVVRRALARACVDSPRKGAHLLRHSLATEMLRKGATLDEIGEVLRHRLQDTTTIYAKVDLAALRGLAQPWPGGEA